MTLYCKRHRKPVEIQKRTIRYTPKMTQEHILRGEKPAEVTEEYLYCPQCHVVMKITPEVQRDLDRMEEVENAREAAV